MESCTLFHFPSKPDFFPRCLFPSSVWWYLVISDTLGQRHLFFFFLLHLHLVFFLPSLASHKHCWKDIIFPSTSCTLHRNSITYNPPLHPVCHFCPAIHPVRLCCRAWFVTLCCWRDWCPLRVGMTDSLPGIPGRDEEGEWQPASSGLTLHR